MTNEPIDVPVRKLITTIYREYFREGNTKKWELKEGPYMYRVKQLPPRDMVAEMGHAIQQDINFKVRFLQQRYHYHMEGDIAHFEGTCLRTINTKTGLIIWRKRSEWFRKLLSDYMFAATIINPDVPAYTLSIPQLWYRPSSIMLLYDWAKEKGVELLPHHEHYAEKFLARMPLEKAITIGHRTTRRIVLRYFRKKGLLSQDRYHYHAMKRANTQKTDPMWYVV